MSTNIIETPADPIKQTASSLSALFKELVRNQVSQCVVYIDRELNNHNYAVAGQIIPEDGWIEYTFRLDQAIDRNPSIYVSRVLVTIYEARGFKVEYLEERHVLTISFKLDVDKLQGM